MRFFRISRAKYDTPSTAFNGEGASKVAHRWNNPDPAIRAVYGSDSLALACLECLVHIRPLPRRFPPSVFYEIDVPAHLLEIAGRSELPSGWEATVATHASRDYGTDFLLAKRAVGLVVPSAIQPRGVNVVLNPSHPKFELKWVRGPFAYEYDGRLE